MANIFGDSRTADSNGVPYELSRDELQELNPPNTFMDDMRQAIERSREYEKEVEQARREGRLH